MPYCYQSMERTCLIGISSKVLEFESQLDECGYGLMISNMLVAYYYNFLIHVYFQQQMKKVLFFLLLTLSSLQSNTHPHSFLLMFTGEGTYYKLQVSSKHVQWYNSLPTNLLSFELANPKDTDTQSSYILPTLDGHFLYIDAQSEILIDRKQVEELLNICFQGHSRKNNINQLSRYFIYEKYQYYIINLNNGNPQELQTFLKTQLPNKLDKMAVLKVSKKFLKQLRQDLSVVWSTISSEIDLVPADKFIKNPKASSSNNKDFLAHSNLKFKRVGNNQIELISQNQSFEIGGSSHIIGIFQFIDSENGYLKHPIEYQYRPKLALEHISHGHSSKQLTSFSTSNSQKINFIHSQQVGRLRKHKKQPQELEYCINTFRTLKVLTDQSKKIFSKEGIPQLNIHKIEIDQNQSLVYPQIQTSSPQNQYIIQYGPTEEQPYIWIALILMILAFVYWFHKMKINSLLNKFTAIESETDKKFQEFKQKLDKFESYQKMYQVYWDKLAYRVGGSHWYEHVVYQGKFLNQPTYVYAVRQQGTDIITLEHKLNTLLNSSHKGLAKLYYYTKNSQFLLIFIEKVPILSTQKLPEYFDFDISNNSKKHLITEIVEAVAYFDSKVQINCLPYQSVCLQKKLSEGQLQPQLFFKLNSIPCLLKKPSEDSQQEDNSWTSEHNTFELRINMVALFHMIIHKGEKFNKQYIDELLKNQAYSQDQYLQFFDFLLYQVKRKEQNNNDKQNNQAQFSQNPRASMFRDILDHPFLWDSKRKILFLSDFSNYIETHIDESKVKKLQSHAKDYNVIKTPWIKQFHFLFVKQVNNYRKYDFESVRDLFRVIRNKLNHFHEISKEVKNHIGKTPQGFIQYCLQLFPKLLHFAYVYTRKKKWKLHMK